MVKAAFFCNVFCVGLLKPEVGVGFIGGKSWLSALVGGTSDTTLFLNAFKKILLIF